MKSYFKEEAKKDFQEMMSQILSNPPPELMQRLASVMSAQQMSTQALQMQLVSTTQPLVTQCTTTIPSSVASTANKVHYPVDDIDRLVACSLVIRYDINNHRTREVVIGLAIPGCKYHERDIPEDYCKVEVLTVIQGYEDDMLDIPGPEGIEKLKQDFKNFILHPLVSTRHPVE
jgi:hypothetical protein